MSSYKVKLSRKRTFHHFVVHFVPLFKKFSTYNNYYWTAQLYYCADAACRIAIMCIPSVYTCTCMSHGLKSQKAKVKMVTFCETLPVFLISSLSVHFSRLGTAVALPFKIFMGWECLSRHWVGSPRHWDGCGRHTLILNFRVLAGELVKDIYCDYHQQKMSSLAMISK